ncbi:CENPB DNA-binding domain-containing protein 1 [Portunus trituberculatus]|uniref:CENPB DNA-binding domain-containing protein 1 n=1 Tax=Portunus trituberculatus TaxID=210409 RepID=A0A5B7DD67_PORTR|nr:CENPB DNA-binding domain-containing protein 1 [Portunus trituberculatus]
MPPKRPTTSLAMLTSIAKKTGKPLTLELKLDIIHRHKRGEKTNSIARHIGLTPSTVSTIFKSADSIKKPDETVSSLQELNLKYRRKDDLIPKNNFHSPRHTPLYTENLQSRGHVLRWVQHLYPMTEGQNKRKERSITNLPTRKIQCSRYLTEDNA